MISVFTPTHRGAERPWLLEAWESILEQTYTDWQWVLVPNNGAVLPESITSDERVLVVPFTGESLEDGRNSIGALKSFACDHCTGDVYVELDDDDLLTPNALEVLVETYADEGVQAAYSNTAEFRDGTWEPRTFSAWWGWKTRPFKYKEHLLEQNIAWPPDPWSLRHIYWSPNHLRSWRASAYRAVGGHNPDHSLVDDHDLNIRCYLMFGKHGVKHIDKCLYLYRLHGDSNCRRFSAEIRQRDSECYDKYVVKLAKRWARDEGLAIYDIGGSLNPAPGFTVVDRREPADIVCNLEGQWPLGDNSAGIIRASHIIEHLPDQIHTMNELYRVLAPGGWAFIEVPSTDGRGAWQDPTHVSFWNENSFWYYTRKAHARFVPEFKGRFQVSELRTYFPTDWWKKNNIPVVRAHLIALKPGYEERRAGEVLI